MTRTLQQQIGKEGEDQAVRHLQENGFTILHRNYRAGKGEIDIICEDKDDRVIVEVKTMRHPGYGSGEERISVKKQREIIRATYRYLEQFPLAGDLGVRFDVIIVNLFKYTGEVIHYRGAFWQMA